jgi:hypothetical protein
MCAERAAKPLRPVTRETTAMVRDLGMRAVMATIASTSGVIELRAKGLRSRYTLDLAWCYRQAAAQHAQQLKAQRRAARRRPA